VKTVDQGGDTQLYYRVVVSQLGIDTFDYQVEGDITVGNPNGAAVHATISESLTGCVVTAIEGLDVPDAALPLTTDVPIDGSTYHYVCDLGDDTVAAGTNTATVTWDRSDYPQSVDDINATGNFTDDASAPFDFDDPPVVENDKTVVVSDDHFNFVPAWVISWGDEVDGVYESAVYSTDTATATGTCSAVITNTATVSAVQIVIGLVAAPPPVLAQNSESGQACVRAVVVSPPRPEPHPNVLPNTGGPQAGVFAVGLALLLGGGTLVLVDQRRRRRS